MRHRMFPSNVVVVVFPPISVRNQLLMRPPLSGVAARHAFGLSQRPLCTRSSEPRLLVRNERDHLVGAGRWTGSDARISSAAEATHSPNLVPAFSAEQQRGREQADAVAVSTNRGKACAWSPMGWPGRRGRETRMRSSGRPGPRDRNVAKDSRWFSLPGHTTHSCPQRRPDNERDRQRPRPAARACGRAIRRGRVIT